MKKHFNKFYVRTSGKSSLGRNYENINKLSCKKNLEFVREFGIQLSNWYFVVWNSFHDDEKDGQKHKQTNRNGNLFTDFALQIYNIYRIQGKQLLRNIRLNKRAIAAMRSVAAITANNHRNS